MTDEDVATLRMMFDDWDERSLREVLETCGSDVQTSVDVILAAGSMQSWRAQRVEPPAVPSGAAAGSEVALGREGASSSNAENPGLVSVVVPPAAEPGSALQINHQGRSFMVQIPEGVQPGHRFNAVIPDPRQPRRDAGPPKRGRPVELPADFLRLPDGLHNEMTDQELAQLLQQQAFMDDGERAPAATRRSTAADQHRGATTSASSSVSSMFSSVGNSMRAGLASATTSFKTMTSRLQQSAVGNRSGRNDDSLPPPGYGRIDLQDELQDPNTPVRADERTEPAQAETSPTTTSDNATTDDDSTTIAL